HVNKSHTSKDQLLCEEGDRQHENHDGDQRQNRDLQYVPAAPDWIGRLNRHWRRKRRTLVGRRTGFRPRILSGRHRSEVNFCSLNLHEKLVECREWLVFEWLTPAVPDMQNVDRVTFNREENPIHMGLLAVEEMPDFEGEDGILRS